MIFLQVEGLTITLFVLSIFLFRFMNLRFLSTLKATVWDLFKKGGEKIFIVIRVQRKSVYSLPFGQAVDNMYWPTSHFN